MLVQILHILELVYLEGKRRYPMRALNRHQAKNQDSGTQCVSMQTVAKRAYWTVLAVVAP